VEEIRIRKKERKYFTMLFVHCAELLQLRRLQSYEYDEYEGLTRKNIRIAFTSKTAENHEKC